MKTLSAEAYDRQKLNELQNLFDRGIIEDDMLPYFRWLKGERIETENPLVLLTQWIQKSDMTDKEIAYYLDNKISLWSVRALRYEYQKSVSENTAQKLLDIIDKK